jgi:hypothetical protein
MEERTTSCSALPNSAATFGVKHFGAKANALTPSLEQTASLAEWHVVAKCKHSPHLKVSSRDFADAAPNTSFLSTIKLLFET